MGFVYVHADAFLHSVASPFHFFVTTLNENVRCVGVRGDAWSVMLSPCNTS